jgi:DNA polymerase III alpha subunit
MKNILAQLNDISSALEDAGLISEASAVHDVFVKVAKKKKSKPKKNVPTNPELYAKCKSEIKKKFDVYPSAYANMALVKLYKSRGGGYKSE